jgi:hypothetical protein
VIQGIAALTGAAGLARQLMPIAPQHADRADDREHHHQIGQPMADQIDRRAGQHRAEEARDREAQGHPAEVGGAVGGIGAMTDHVLAGHLHQQRACADQRTGDQQRADVGDRVRE